MNGSSALEESLLREGAASYWLARAAIKEYQALVFRRCREIVQVEQPHLLAAFGYSLDKMKDFDAFEMSTHYAALGVSATGTDGCKHVFALWWEGDKLYASVWISFNDKDQRLRAWERLQNVHGREAASFNPTEIWLRTEISPYDAGNPWIHLSSCIQKWSAMWRQVPGGLRDFFVPSE